MKAKHLQARIAQCLALAECSNCPRRKFGAVLLDPARNVVLMDGYNGGPRGGGPLCAGDWCERDGLKPEDIEVRGPNGVDDHDMEDSWVFVRGKQVSIPVTVDGEVTWKAHGWRDECLAYRDRLLAENPPIKSGTHYELGCHHAEQNVICNTAASNVSAVGAWLILTGEPCILCARLIHHAGITKVICVKGGFAGGDRGPDYLRKHGVEVEYVDGPQDPRLA